MNRKERRANKAPISNPAAQQLTNEGLRHHQAGRLAEAEKLYRQALNIDPRHADALHLLGVLADNLGRHDVAVEMIGQAVALQDNVFFFHNNLGNALKNLGRTDDAMKHYKRALALKPDFAEAHNNLGNILMEQGQYKDALNHYKRTIALNAGHHETHNNIGTVLRHLKKFDEAMAAYNQALALKPDYAEAHLNVGCLFRDQGNFSGALPCFERAATLKLGYVDAYVHLGHSLHRLDRLDEAVTNFQRALALDPNSTEALNNLGNTLVLQGRLDEAIASYKRALPLKPDVPHFYSNLLLAMVYAASVPPMELAATAQAFGEKLADPLRRQRPFTNDRNSERKLRIGYVSPDFHEHAVNYFFEPLLKMRDRQQFEVFAYSNVKQEDDVTARLKSSFDHWRDIRGLDDDKAADLIETDKIDILVDMTGHTGDNRLMVFARKPAPVQATWLGWPATTGMKAMDYRITDAYAEPPGMTEKLSTETLWRLPGMFCCYQPHEKSPAVIDHPPFEDNGYITFGCFNNFAKVTDLVLTTWARILNAVPNARLLFEITGLESPQYRANIEARLQRLGLPLDRIILEPRKPANRFVLYNRIDIALDPFPCNGGTTSLDTLWMGVPFVTLSGEHFVSRMGVTILTNAGIAELIAKNADEYVKLAADLAQNKDRLRALRHNLRDKIAASPLMNQSAFTRNMETAYREMWRTWCNES